jgi:hypothetical protein
MQCNVRRASRDVPEVPAVGNTAASDRRSVLWRFNGRDVPDIAVLNLPDSNMGSRLVHQTNFEQTSLGWNRLFRRFWSIPDVKHRNMNSLTALFHGRGKQTMVVVGQVASRAQVWIFDLFDSA